MFEQFPYNPPLHHHYHHLWPPAVAVGADGGGDYGGLGSVDDTLHPGGPAGGGDGPGDGGRQDYVDVAADFSSQHHPYQLLPETDW